MQTAAWPETHIALGMETHVPDMHPLLKGKKMDSVSMKYPPTHIFPIESNGSTFACL